MKQGSTAEGPLGGQELPWIRKTNAGTGAAPGNISQLHRLIKAENLKMFLGGRAPLVSEGIPCKAMQRERQW